LCPSLDETDASCNANCNAKKQRCRSNAQPVALNPSECGAMSIDIGFAIQVAVLAGQAVKFGIGTAERWRYERGLAARHRAWYPVGGCVHAAVPCPGSGSPRPWAARTCGRTVARRAGGHAQPAIGEAHPDGSRIRWTVGQARWACRSRDWRHPHGRHRRCS
jgi:hypothetical protein